MFGRKLPKNRLRALQHSAESKKFSLDSPISEFRAMQSNLISKENIFNKNSALCSIAHIHEYLRKFETELENILGYYSGA
jgi:hypothetical protein